MPPAFCAIIRKLKPQIASHIAARQIITMITPSRGEVGTNHRLDLRRSRQREAVLFFSYFLISLYFFFFFWLLVFSYFLVAFEFLFLVSAVPSRAC
jgi:hypothetical protein